MSETHYRNLEQAYLSAPCNEYYRPEIRIEKGRAEIIIPVREDFFHAAGAVHGSVYFKALDDAAYFAVNSLVADVFVLTVSFTLHLMRPIDSGVLRAVGQAFYRGKQFYGGESQLFDHQGREIARGSGIFARSKMAIPPAGNDR